MGTSVRPFVAKDQWGKTFDLAKALKKGPLIVMFYRGQWCPVCNRHLSNLQDSLSYIYAAGASIVAISPEKPEYLAKTAEKTKATFTLLYDEDYKISQDFDVLFRPSKATTTLYNTFAGAKLKKAQSDESQRLPIPATFIIGQDGKILWRQFDPNYKVRASVTEMLTNIPAAKR